jgi:hypothetical protein
MGESTIPTTTLANLPTAAEKAILTAQASSGMLGFSGAEEVLLGAPVIADADRIVTTVDFADGTLTIAAQPDCPRNITATLTDADNSASGVLTITGKDIAGRTIVEVMEPDGAGGGKTLTGTKIFAVVDSVVVSSMSGGTTDDEVVVGVGNVIGLPKDIATSGAVKHVHLGGARVATPTVATGVSKSGVDVNASTYNGTKLLTACYIPAT